MSDPAVVLPADGEVVQRIEVDAVVADAEVVEQRRRDRLLVRHERVLVLARLVEPAGRAEGAEPVEGVDPVVASVDARRVGEDLVDTRTSNLVDVVLGQHRPLVVVGRARQVRHAGSTGAGRAPRRRELRERDLVARVGHLRERVDDLGRNLAEVTAAHALGRHRPDRAGGALRPQALVGAHEERLVGAVVEAGDHDRAVELHAELVAALGRLGQVRVVEVAPALERVVLEVLEQGAVELVGASLGHDVDVHAEVRSRTRPTCCPSAPRPPAPRRPWAACWSSPAGSTSR